MGSKDNKPRNTALTAANASNGQGRQKETEKTSKTPPKVSTPKPVRQWASGTALDEQRTPVFEYQKVSGGREVMTSTEPPVTDKHDGYDCRKRRLLLTESEHHLASDIIKMNSTKVEPCVPIPLDSEVLKDIVDKAKDWVIMHGVGLRLKDKYCTDNMYFAPFMLFPSSFPRDEFERALSIQTIVNELTHKVAYNHEFLATHLKRTILADDFTNRLYKLYMTMREEGVNQRVALGLIRSDLMLESCTAVAAAAGVFSCWKQIEVNTIGAGFGWLGPVSAMVHSYVLSELGYPEKLENLPKNVATQALSQGMIDAWELYGQPNAVVMFLVEEVTYNICDQRFLEFEVRNLNPAVRVIRRTFAQLSQQAKLVGPDKRLIVGNLEVAVVYFRSGYDPANYAGEAAWDMRYLIERSLAIKCPNVNYQLAGTKKVQQALALPGVLEMLLQDPVKAAAIKETFAGLYSLDLDEAGDRAVEMALTDPCRFVLKPQREGGGNNVYDMDIKAELERVKNSNERESYILMDRIIPPVQQNYMLRAGQEGLPEPVGVVSELGVYGVIIGDDSKIIINRPAGHMLRTKLACSNEAGVMAGCGALDSPYLI